MFAKRRIGFLLLVALLATGASAGAETLTVTLLANTAATTLTGGSISYTPEGDGLHASKVALSPDAAGTISLDVYVALDDGSPGNDGLQQLIGGFYNTSGSSGGVFNGYFTATNATNDPFSVCVAGTTQPNGNVYGSNTFSSTSGWWGGAAVLEQVSSHTYACYNVPSSPPGFLFGTVAFTLGGAATSGTNFGQAGYVNDLYFYPLNCLGASPTATQLAGFTNGNQTAFTLPGAKWMLNASTGPVTVGTWSGTGLASSSGTLRSITLTTFDGAPDNSRVNFANNPFELDGLAAVGALPGHSGVFYGATVFSGTGTEIDLGGPTPGNSAGNYTQLSVVTNPGNLSNRGDLTLMPGTTFNIVDWNNFTPAPDETFTVLNWDGTLTGAASLVIDPAFASQGIQLVPQWNSNSLVLEVVPEPSTFALLGAAIFVLLVHGWRRHR